MVQYNTTTPPGVGGGGCVIAGLFIDLCTYLKDDRDLFRWEIASLLACKYDGVC